MYLAAKSRREKHQQASNDKHGDIRHPSSLSAAHWHFLYEILCRIIPLLSVPTESF
jgi:hypothetical protein